MPAKSAQEGDDVSGVKTNEREGTRAVLRHSRMSAYKVRQVLNLIREQDVVLAAEILANGDREAAAVVGKVLASAVANAVHNDGLDGDELFVSACFADEGSTLKRWRPRARGRATRIRKRTCHITIIVSRMPDERIARRRAKQSAAGAQRSRRVSSSRRQRTEVAQQSGPTIAAEESTVSTDTGVDESAVAEAVTTNGIEGEAEGTETETVPAETTDSDTATDETNGDTAEEKG